MQQYLNTSTYINFDHPEVLANAQELALGCADSEQIAKRCFEFVRDEIKHSCDYRLSPVTCRRQMC